MGNIFSSASAHQRHLIDPKLVAHAVNISALSQYFIFNVTTNHVFDLFKHEGMPPADSPLYLNAKKEINGGPKYVTSLSNIILEMPLLMSMLHQMGVARLYQVAVQRKVSPFPMLYFGMMANVVLAALAWRTPIRLLAYAEEVQQGNVMVFAHLREIVEEADATDTGKAAILGTGLMSLCVWSLGKQNLPWTFKMYPILALAVAANYGPTIYKEFAR